MLSELQQAFQLSETQEGVKSGQALLYKLRREANYPILLLEYLKNSATFNGKLRSAIELRIWCQQYKDYEEFQRTQYQGIIEDVKTNMLFAFLSYSDKIEKTLLPGIVALSVTEYPERWSGLIPGLINYCYQNNHAILKTLQLMSEITHKYSYLSRSDPLYHEINVTCDTFHKFLLEMTRNTIQSVLQDQTQEDLLKILEQQMILFYNLNYQDLHPNFEDNLQQWMQILKTVMNLPNRNEWCFKCKGASLQSILLYASKYKEDVEDSIKDFSEQIWQLCANALPDAEYDDIVLNALKYFRSLIMWKDMREFFATNINSLISNLIIPNLELNNFYKQLFEEQIDHFIGYFFRNTEINSRRSAAVELLQALVRNYPEFQQFLQEQLKTFVSSQDNINGLCLLLTLVIESAPKGFRDIDGATQLHYDQNIVTGCYDSFVKGMLQNLFSKMMQNPDKPIQKKLSLYEIITAFRFIFYFRIYLPTSDLPLIIKLCCNLKTENDSIKQVLLLMNNAMLNVRHGNYFLYKDLVNCFNQENIKEVALDLFKFIMAYNEEDSVINPSLARLLLNTLKLLKGSASEFYEYQLNPLLISMLKKTATFNFDSVFSLFEAIGQLAYHLCRTKSPHCQQLETLIQQFFHQMIQSQSDILNFCFQILSIFLQLNPGDASFYDNIYNSIIRVENWSEDNLSLMSAYIQYISAYISINNNRIMNDKGVYETILSKLIELDHYELFYRLVRTILKIGNLQNFYHWGYMQILVKGTEFISQKSLEGRKNALIFIFEITYELQTEKVVNCLNMIKNNFYEELLLSNQDIIQSMQAFKHRKVMFGSICNALVKMCFSSPNNEAMMINLLVENGTSRFQRRNLIAEHNNAQAAVNKKESTYKKLNVFKEFENVEQPVSLDEEVVLLQAFQMCTQEHPDVKNFLSEKSMQRLQRLYDKHKG